MKLNEILLIKGFYRSRLSVQNLAFFSTLESITEISSNLRSGQIVFTLDDSLRDLLEFQPVMIQEESNLSHYHLDKLSFVTISLGPVIAR